MHDVVVGFNGARKGGVRVIGLGHGQYAVLVLCVLGYMYGGVCDCAWGTKWAIRVGAQAVVNPIGGFCCAWLLEEPVARRSNFARGCFGGWWFGKLKEGVIADANREPV